MHLDRARGIRVHLRLRDAADLVAPPIGARDPLHAELARQLALHCGGRDPCRAPRTARRLAVSSARHFPSLTVRVIRAIWL